ncbi:MAG: ribosome assembly RNA-binding protein YhbY [Defluviitaleaceae bacterium]|nr:ribosome assembly RNA-binding protein YhbY [Defluviitaleaceae bacterium]
MLSSKERATLRAMANKMPAIFRLGKDGITQDFLAAIRDALEARELIKIDILNNCEIDVRDAAEEIARRTNAQVVQTIGKRFVLYRKSYTKKEGIL